MIRYILALAALIATPAFAAPAPACGSTVVVTGDQGALLRPSANCPAPLPPITYDATAPGTRADRVYMLGVKGVVLKGGTWGKAGAPTPAVTVDSSRDVRITGATLTGSASGISFVRGSDYTADNNRFDGLRADGVLINQSQRVAVKSNVFLAFLWRDGDHADAIQAFSLRGQVPTTDLDISDNVIYSDAQGIDNFGDAGGMARVRIERNVVYSTFWHGITFNNVADLTVRDNVVRTLPSTRPELRGVRTWVNVSGSTGVTACGNTVPSFPAGVGVGPC